jgi:tRNA pseudouridine32 synthase/23S rRNA pseudouridine746 synthase
MARTHNLQLPMRDGVSASCVALPCGPWPTLLDFLVHRLPKVSRQDWLQRMQAGEVLDADGVAVQAHMPYRPQHKLYYYRSLPPEPRVPFDEQVLFRDEHLLVVDKPHFLPVTPSGRYLQETLLVRLKRRLNLPTLAPMHRIDRETAGLVLFTLQPQARNAYQSLFRDRVVHKQYEAIAPHRAGLQFPLTYRSRLVDNEDAFMVMDEVDGEPNAETAIELLEVRGDQARYALSPLTGKRHQLRVQMAALGLPIANDQIYPTLQPEGQPDYDRPLKLLARTLAFTDPISGQPRRFESRLTLQF